MVVLDSLQQQLQLSRFVFLLALLQSPQNEESRKPHLQCFKSHFSGIKSQQMVLGSNSRLSVLWCEPMQTGTKIGHAEEGGKRVKLTRGEQINRRCKDVSICVTEDITMHTLHQQSATDGRRQQMKMKQADALQVHCCDYIDALCVSTVRVRCIAMHYDADIALRLVELEAGS